MFQVLNCTAQEAEMSRFEFDHFNTRIREKGFHYEVYTDKLGKVHINIDKDKFNARSVVTGYTKIFDDLQQIVREYGMLSYEESYSTDVDIYDGDSWKMYIDYADGKHYRSGGYEAWPRNYRAMTEALNRYFIPWRLVPATLGIVSEKDAEEFLAGFEKHIDSELTSFRYERYNYGKSKVYYTSKHDSFTGFYIRKWDSNQGVNYYCANPQILKDLKEVVEKHHLAGFPQTPLDKENTKKSRWLVEAKFADGTKIEIVDYIPDNSFDYDRKIERDVDKIFEEEHKAIGAKSPAEKGEYTVTTYDANGKPSRKINYSGDGRVLNGYDYKNPNMTF